MSDQTLGTISALVRLKLDQLAADAAAAGSIFTGLGQAASASIDKLANVSAQQFGQIGALAKQAGQDMALAGTAIVGALGVAVKSGEDWNQTLLHISGNTSMTQKQTEEMRSVVEHLGQTAAAPLDRLANGYMHVTNFAFKGAEATKILTEATKYAVATGDDASKVSEVLAGTLHNFALGGEQAGGAMNLLHTAAARANSTLGEFASAAGPAFAAAHTYGISLAEAAAAIQVFTQHQYSASEGTTLFANLVEHVANPTRITKKALEDLGLENSKLAKDMTFTGLQAVGVAGFLKDLDEAAKSTGKSSEELAKTLFRGRMGGTGTAVLVQNLREYTKAAKELQEIFDKGAAGIWQFDAANKSLTGQIEILKNNFVILSGQIEAALLPALNGILNSIHELTTWFQNLTTPQKEMIVQTTAVAGVALLAGGAMLSLTGAVLSFVASAALALPALIEIGAALVPLAPWILGIGAAIALLTTAWVQDWGQIREHVQQFTDWAVPKFMAAMKEIGGFFSEIGRIAKEFFAAIAHELEGGKEAWQSAWNVIVAAVKLAWSLIEGVVKTAWHIISGVILVGLNLITFNFSGAWNAMKGMLGHILDDMVGMVRGACNAMADAIQTLFFNVQHEQNIGDAAEAQASAIFGGQMRRVGGKSIAAGALGGGAVTGGGGGGAPRHRTSSAGGGGGGGGRGSGGGSSAMDDLKERAQEAKRALNEVYEALYKLSHDDFDNQRHDAMKEFLELRARGVNEIANAQLLAAKQLKIQHDEEEAHYQKMSALQKRANDMAALMLKPGRDLAAVMDQLGKSAGVFATQLGIAYQALGQDKEGLSRAADAALSGLLGGGDLGSGSQLGSLFAKTVAAAKAAKEEMDAQADAAAGAWSEDVGKAIDKVNSQYERHARQMARVVRGMADQMTNVFEGAFTDLFEHGWKSFFKDILQGFTKMLEQMVAQLLAKSIIFGFLSLFGGGLPGQKSFFSFLGFDDASNDRKAEHWGFDFADMFGRGMKDFDNKRSPTMGAPTSGQTVVHAPITVHAVINHEMDIKRVADQLAWHIQTRGAVYQGTG
jgi:TP901 family phage tail tape measure protein